MMGFIEKLCSRPVLRQAWDKVAAKRGAPGIDRVSVDDFAAALESNLEKLSDEIRSRKYRPHPAVRIRPRFLGASERPLVILCVRDRVAQRAMADLLSPSIEPTLSASCRAFRKGSSALSAADDIARWIQAGEPWVLRADIQSFFDTIPQGPLSEGLQPFVDEEGLRFLRGTLRCRIFDQNEFSEMVVGIAQGSPLSPLRRCRIAALPGQRTSGPAEAPEDLRNLAREGRSGQPPTGGDHPRMAGV